MTVIIPYSYLLTVDDIKLKKCAACKFVRYCSIKCQKEHRSTHKQECKKRAAELRDALLFKQPESSNLGDCPICFLPLPVDVKKSLLNSCCSKLICKGCEYASRLLETEEEHERHKCPYCRKVYPNTQKEMDSNTMKRAEVNDPVALRNMGLRCYNDEDYGGAFEYFIKAIELGDVESNCQLSTMYDKGQGVERNKKKDT